MIYIYIYFPKFWCQPDSGAVPINSFFSNV